MLYNTRIIACHLLEIMMNCLKQLDSLDTLICNHNL